MPAHAFYSEEREMKGMLNVSSLFSEKFCRGFFIVTCTAL